MTVLLVQAMNDSRTLTYIVENFLNLSKHQSQNEHTSISKHPSQTDAFYQMKSPSEKGENSFINVET